MRSEAIPPTEGIVRRRKRQQHVDGEGRAGQSDSQPRPAGPGAGRHHAEAERGERGRRQPAADVAAGIVEQRVVAAGDDGEHQHHEGEPAAGDQGARIVGTGLATPGADALECQPADHHEERQRHGSRAGVDEPASSRDIGGRDVDAVAVDDRRRMTLARNRCLPTDAVASTPARRQRPIDPAFSLAAAPRGPGVGVRNRRRNHLRRGWFCREGRGRERRAAPGR